MSLTTTMGVELTWVPQALQIALDRGAGFDPQEAPGESNLTNALAIIMRTLITAKNIPTYRNAYVDPGCVEIATKPYKKLSSLLSVYRRLNREAVAIGLTPTAEYTGGGGAHIHTGIIGDTNAERDMYVKRMMLFAAMNPWMCWATLNVVDDINAKPISREMLVPVERESLSEQDLINRVQRRERNLIEGVNELHIANIWGDTERNRYWRRIYENNVNDARTMLISARKALHALRMRLKAETDGPTNHIPVSKICYGGNKDHMVRHTRYGQNGTIEFRSFEMGDEAKLKRNIILANAICRYVERWDITEYNPNELMSGAQIRALKWSQAKAGWLGMLDTLGLDRADYREETAQIARRWRFARGEKINPTAADEHSSRAAPQTDHGQLAAMHRADREREQTVAATRAQARWERRQERGGRRPVYGPSATLDGVPVTCSLFAGRCDDSYSMAA